MTPRVFRVRDKTPEPDGSFTVHLAPEDGTPCGAFSPGQFNMLYAFGGGEVPISFSGSPRDTDCWVHTIRPVGAVTGMLERLAAGDSVGVRGPFGHGWPMDKVRDKDLLVVAGGLGLAPLRPVLLDYLAGATGIRSLHLFYGAREPDGILYRDEIDTWRQAFPVDVTVDHAGPDWRGNVGVVTTLLGKADIDPKNTVAFVCGPEVMMRFTLQQLLMRKLTVSRVFLSMERNMKCATGHCGHCQWGPRFICKDGPVFSYQEVARWLQVREL